MLINVYEPNILFSFDITQRNFLHYIKKKPQLFYELYLKLENMDLGISMFGDLRLDPQTQQRKAPHQRFTEMLEQVKLADEVGLDVFEMGEHHRADYSVTNPQLFLSAAAAVTKNIKLGSAVTVLSSSDPVRLFEDFSMLDQLSKGRAHIMAGRGSFIESFPLL